MAGPAGGSGSITAALAALLQELGGKIETGVRIEVASQVPAVDVTLLDLAPDVTARLLNERLRPSVARALRRFRRAPGAFKVDFAVEEGVPWANPACRSRRYRAPGRQLCRDRSHRA